MYFTVKKKKHRYLEVPQLIESLKNKLGRSGGIIMVSLTVQRELQLSVWCNSF